MTIEATSKAVLPAPRSARTGRLTTYDRFIATVRQRCEADAGARSALRSGVGKGLDAVPRMHQVIAHLVPAAVDERTQHAYYAVAAMIAETSRRQQSADTVNEPGQGDAFESSHGSGQEPGEAVASEGRSDYGSSLGAAFAMAVLEGPGRDRVMRRGTAESRLNVLCKQQFSGLHRHLPASVRYLRSLGVPLDFARLLQDLTDWPRDSRRITRRWLQDFYRHLQAEDRRSADKHDTALVTEAEETPPAT